MIEDSLCGKKDLPACSKCGSRDHSAAFCKKEVPR